MNGPSQETIDHLRKVATPAHLAQYVTKDLPPDTQWRPFKHLLYLNDKLMEAVTSDEQSFLNVAMSVRHGKSELISRYLVIWYLGMFPDRQVIIVSYNETKAAEWGTFTRDVMKKYGPELFGIHVDTETASKTDWKIKGRRGGVRAVGVNGSLTGIGGDLIIIDDPIKNREEADSQAARDNMFSWYGSTLRTRLQPKGTMILTMARWHTDDLTGKIEQAQAEKPNGDPWTKVSLPAIAEAPEPPEDLPVEKSEEWQEAWRDEIGRKQGEALWPEIWSAAMLAQIQASILAADWDSLYQQSPTAREGGMFKVANWQRRSSVERASLRLCRAWDLAATDGGGDWSVGALMGMSATNEVFILDVQRFQMDSAGVKQQVLATAQADGKFVPIRIEQERAGAGKAQIADYKRLLIGFVVNGRKPEGTKAQRAAPYASQQQSNNVYLVGLPESIEKALVEEHRVFDKGRHDDIVDACSGAFDELAQVSPVEITTSEDVGSLPLDGLVGAGFGARRQFNIPVG